MVGVIGVLAVCIALACTLGCIAVAHIPVVVHTGKGIGVAVTSGWTGVGHIGVTLGTHPVTLVLDTVGIRVLTSTTLVRSVPALMIVTLLAIWTIAILTTLVALAIIRTDFLSIRTPAGRTRVGIGVTGLTIWTILSCYTLYTTAVLQPVGLVLWTTDVQGRGDAYLDTYVVVHCALIFVLRLRTLAYIRALRYTHTLLAHILVIAPGSRTALPVQRTGPADRNLVYTVSRGRIADLSFRTAVILTAHTLVAGWHTILAIT